MERSDHRKRRTKINNFFSSPIQVIILTFIAWSIPNTIFSPPAAQMGSPRLTPRKPAALLGRYSTVSYQACLGAHCRECNPATHCLGSEALF